MALRQTYLSLKRWLPDGAEAVLVMRGRGNDELAPSEALLGDFNRFKAEFVPGCGWESDVHFAWAKSNYAERFELQIKSDPAAMARLRDLADRARTKDVFLVCYEGDDKPCHRKLLLKIAEEEFGAVVDPAPFQPDGARGEADRTKEPTLF